MKLFACAALIGTLVAFSTSAQAVTFDVSGANLYGQTVSGTIEADAGLTTINAINLQVSGSIFNPYNVIAGYSGNVLSAQSANLFQTKIISLFFSSTDTDAYLANLHSQIVADQKNMQDFLNFILANCNGDAACQQAANQQFSLDMTVFFQRNQLLFAATVVAEALPTPLPAALPLFASGFAFLGWAARRRKQRQVA